MKLTKITSLVLFSSVALGACVVTDDGDTDAGTGTDATMSTTASTTASTTDSTTDSTTASTTDSTTASTTVSTTDTDVSVTDTDVTGDTTDATDTDPTGESTGGGGACGWLVKDAFYGCGGEGEDPKGISDINCAEVPEIGAPCDPEKGPITGIGCCTEDGANAYCTTDGTVDIERC